MFDIAVARMKGQGRPAHQVWLPPLDVPTLDGPAARRPRPRTPTCGLVSTRWRERGSYVLPVGHRRPAARAAPRALRAAARRGVGARRGRRRPALGPLDDGRAPSSAPSRSPTTPLESQVYVLDFGGGTFTPWPSSRTSPGWPNRSEPEVVRRTRGRGARHRRRAGALLPRARHRLHRDLPQPAGRGPGRRRLRRRVPRRRRLAHACAPSSTSSRPRSTTSPGGGSPSGCTSSSPLALDGLPQPDPRRARHPHRDAAR